MFKKFILIFPLIYLYLKDNKFFTNFPPPVGRLVKSLPTGMRGWGIWLQQVYIQN